MGSTERRSYPNPEIGDKYYDDNLHNNVNKLSAMIQSEAYEYEQMDLSKIDETLLKDNLSYWRFIKANSFVPVLGILEFTVDDE